MHGRQATVRDVLHLHDLELAELRAFRFVTESFYAASILRDAAVRVRAPVSGAIFQCRCFHNYLRRTSCSQ